MKKGMYALEAIPWLVGDRRFRQLLIALGVERSQLAKFSGEDLADLVHERVEGLCEAVGPSAADGEVSRGWALSEYLRCNQISATEFARQVGVPASTITRLIRNERSPGVGLIVKIWVATHGMVGPEDWCRGAFTQ